MHMFTPITLKLSKLRSLGVQDRSPKYQRCAAVIFANDSSGSQVVINDALVDIEKVTAADINLIGYEPHGKLDMTMAV
jgi:hypothetical protein